LTPKVAAESNWIRTETPLFVLDNKGRLYRAGFDRRPWKLVSDHGLRGRQPDVEVSNGGRWLLYGEANLGSIPEPRRHWLFDTHTGRDRPVPEGSDPALSPDGRMLTRDTKGAVELVDVMTLAVRAIPFPTGLAGYYDVDWSVDGDLLLWSGNDPRRTWVYLPGSGRFEPIEGGFEKGIGTVYRRNGAAIELLDTTSSANSLLWQELDSPDGKATVRVDDNYRLVVQVGSKSPRTVAQGRYDDCLGITIGVLGWLDGHAYLVYSVDEVDYVYGVASGRSARLFGEEDDVAAYAWPGWKSHLRP
jgi:hypothetical protein